MPLTEEEITRVVFECLPSFERDHLRAWFSDQLALNVLGEPTRRRTYDNELALRYSPLDAAMTSEEARKGVANRGGKGFFQIVMRRLADMVDGQDVHDGDSKVDFSVKRFYESEWFDDVCVRHAKHSRNIDELSRRRSTKYRTYLVQLKSTPTTESGGTKKDTYAGLIDLARNKLKEDKGLDVVPVYYNVYGTVAAMRSHCKRQAESIRCYELSGACGFDWLIGDPTGALFRAFCRAIQLAPMDPQLKTLLIQGGLR